MTVAEMEAKAGHLMAAHWAEVEGDRAPLCVNWDRFREFEDLGLVMIQGAYVDDELVGYCVLTLNVHLFEDAKPARISAIYVDPGRRSGCIGTSLAACGSIGVSLARWAINAAKQVGATQIAGHGRSGEAACRLYAALGFDERETVYVKEIGDVRG